MLLNSKNKDKVLATQKIKITCKQQMKKNKDHKYGRHFTFFPSLIVNLDLSRMHLIISGMCDQFWVKQIFSLDSEAIKFLENALDIFFILFFVTICNF